MKRIPLTQGLFALVDDEDFEWLSQWKWHAHKHGNRWYAMRGETRAGREQRHFYMHNEIMGQPPSGLEWDHENRNGLDNQQSNLRAATRGQNMRNTAIQRNNTSGYKGVNWSNSNKGWVAHISVKGENVNLGTHSSPEDAARAYDAAALLYSGEFAWLNFPDES